MGKYEKFTLIDALKTFPEVFFALGVMYFNIKWTKWS